MALPGIIRNSFYILVLLFLFACENNKKNQTPVVKKEITEKKVDIPKPIIEEDFSLNLGVLDLEEFNNNTYDDIAKEALTSNVFCINQYLSTETHDVGELKKEFELNKQCSKIMNDFEEKINLL